MTNLARRKLLATLTGTVTVMSAGCVADPIVNEVLNGTDTESGADETADGVKTGLNGVLNRMEWADDRRSLQVWFQEEHDSDFVLLLHEADDTVIWQDDAPRFDGPVTVPVVDALACDDADYPSRTFEIVAGTGVIGIVSNVEEFTARQPFEVSEETMTMADEREVDATVCGDMAL